MKTDRAHHRNPLKKQDPGPWHRLIMLAITWGMASALLACSPSSGENGYQGISEKHPTGSWLISPDKLVVAFDMETTTTEGWLYDFSPHQHHSVLMGTTTAPGLFGDARQFRTTGDRVDLPETSALAMDGPLSIALWFRIDTADLHQHILAADDKFVVWVNQANRIRFTDTRGNGLETRDSIEDGQWYSLAAVWKGTYGTQLSKDNIQLYLDGDVIPANRVGQPPDETPTWKPGLLYPADAVYIGFESHQGEAMHKELPLQGLIDEVLVFSRALSQHEIIAHADREE